MNLPAENGVHVWRCALVMSCITFLFVAAQLYSSLGVMKRTLSKEDFTLSLPPFSVSFICADRSKGLVGATFISLILYSILIAMAASNGLGLHIWQYTEDTNSQCYKWVGIASEFWLLGSMGFKMSLLSLYLQLAGSNQKLWWTVYVAMFYVMDWLVGNIVTGFLPCIPRDKAWHQKETGWCIQSKAADVVFGAGNVSSDLVLAIIPLLLMRRKRLVTTQPKIEFSVVISSGFFPRWHDMRLHSDQWSINVISMPNSQ
ncbi:hypothetical protein PG994_015093 [Apiospora phragmitis]|uniref:Rhodopsin domain-containing protein n=1 Tax=Apiospora phragmitis TaxID=2905665 RepID=A0ABR1SVG0_9PEZI